MHMDQGVLPVPGSWSSIQRWWLANENKLGEALHDLCRLDVEMVGRKSKHKLNLWCTCPGPSRAPACALCPVEGGLLKRTTCGRWVHSACTLWVPETAIDCDVGLVDGLQYIPKACHRLPVQTPISALINPTPQEG